MGLRGATIGINKETGRAILNNVAEDGLRTPDLVSKNVPTYHPRDRAITNPANHQPLRIRKSDEARNAGKEMLYEPQFKFRVDGSKNPWSMWSG